MKKTILLLISVFITVNSFAQFKLQSGDLLFQLGKSSSLTDAIALVTSGENNVDYTHVGIVSIENNEVFVIEATAPIVRKVSIDTFFNESRQIDGKPVVAVGRLKSRYYDIIPAAIANAEKYIGKAYDYVYLPDNDDYYCSELVYLSFKNKKGRPIFKSVKMSFLDEDGNMPEEWIEHFEKHKTPIPEGREGTNPAEMSKAKQLDIVYRYFD